MRYAMIDASNNVMNVIEAGGGLTEWDGHSLIALQDGQFCSPGGTYNPDTQTFSAPPPPAKVPQPISMFGLFELIQAVAGISDATLVAAHNDPNLAALWVKASFMPSSFLTDDDHTAAVFSALVANSYLTTDNVAAIKAAWPAS